MTDDDGDGFAAAVWAAHDREVNRERRRRAAAQCTVAAVLAAAAVWIAVHL